MRLQTNQKGFTLIELLVVIAIIGLLAAIVLTAVTNARKKARTAQRLTDLRQIANALELYYYDNNATYPNTNGQWNTQCPTWGGQTASNVIPGLVPKYLPQFPADPQMDLVNSRSCYLYRSDTEGKQYKLLDHDIAEYSAADYLSVKGFQDARRDSGVNDQAGWCAFDGVSPWSLALASPNATGMNQGPNSVTEPHGALCW